uniref:UPAR/Ly6 domain-containing protein n=1 Tax=Magallana gigas TaxID=29159 RepID=A0A8W8KSJ0_MAGGI|eukprot:XP_019919828.1 PREDICTED: uncharacterized protein LOC105320744 [Crassostrea gigas]
MVTTGTLCPLILFWTSLIHLALLPASVSPLSCYQCTNEKTNIHCVDDFNLRSCDKDTCQTITSYSDVSEKLTILKSCTTNASCHNQRQEYERSCNVEASDWVCVYCCHHDKCNIHIASGTTSPLSPKSALLSQILDYVFISLLIIPVSKCILAET